MRLRDGLSATFASNVGADVTTVLNGSVTLSSADTPGPGTTRAFDIDIPFTTPFLYNPANGNLLLDILNEDTDNNVVTDIFFDGRETSIPNDPISRVLGAEGSPSDTMANVVDSAGLITRFSISPIPEPETLGLLLLAFGFSVVGRRR